jgi:hypothetical protein
MDYKRPKSSPIIGSTPEPVISTASILPMLSGKKLNGDFLKVLLTFLLICITWVFFRSATFAGAWQLLGAMFARQGATLPLLTTIAIIKVGVVVSLMLIFHWIMRDTTVLKVTGKIPAWGVGVIWSFMLIMIILSQESSKSFIYFQF